MQLPTIIAGFPCERSSFLITYGIIAAVVIGSVAGVAFLAKRKSFKPKAKYVLMAITALLTLALGVVYWHEAIPYHCRQPFLENLTDPNSGYR
jgi:uncharacterized membrane protein HdeD (DUF308 family)